MPYVAYVDLSAKVEQWTLDSAIAVSNGTARALLVPARIKQEARRFLNERHGTKSTQYRVLAVLVYLAVRDDLPNIRQLVIDLDYSGQAVEATIKNLLLTLLRQSMPDVSAGYIRVENVKGSKADHLARQVYQGKAEAIRVVSWAEVRAALDK